mmetsp:Transcript_27215/g.51820  ORF Transcript_27215/g.51820 Transcript_27215/m.51820 type:complete len:226 (-) Transcript_27215:447-1124(-)
MEVMDVVPYSTYRVVDGHCGYAQRIIPHPSCMMQGFGIEIACDPCPCGTCCSWSCFCPSFVSFLAFALGCGCGYGYGDHSWGDSWHGWVWMRLERPISGHLASAPQCLGAAVEHLSQNSFLAIAIRGLYRTWLRTGASPNAQKREAGEYDPQRALCPEQAPVEGYLLILIGEHGCFWDRRERRYALRTAWLPRCTSPRHNPSALPQSQPEQETDLTAMSTCGDPW